MTRHAHTNPGTFLSILDEQPSFVERSLIRVIPGFNPRLPLPGDPDPFSALALADLTLSVREQGILQPLLLRPARGGTYELIAGERRFHAAGFAGLKEVPVHIRELDDEQARLAALTENGQRTAVPYAQETMTGLRDIARRAQLPLEDVPALLNRLKNGAEDEYGVVPYLRSVFGETVSTWAQRRALVLKLSPAELSALNERKVNLTALQHLTRLGNRPERLVWLEGLLRSEITADEVARRVTELLADRKDEGADHALQLKRALPRLRRLSGPDAARADVLIRELLSLLAE